MSIGSRQQLASNKGYPTSKKYKITSYAFRNDCITLLVIKLSPLNVISKTLPLSVWTTDSVCFSRSFYSLTIVTHYIKPSQKDTQFEYRSTFEIWKWTSLSLYMLLACQHEKIPSECNCFKYILIMLLKNVSVVISLEINKQNFFSWAIHQWLRIVLLFWIGPAQGFYFSQFKKISDVFESWKSYSNSIKVNNNVIDNVIPCLDLKIILVKMLNDKKW